MSGNPAALTRTRCLPGLIFMYLKRTAELSRMSNIFFIKKNCGACWFDFQF